MLLINSHKVRIEKWRSTHVTNKYYGIKANLKVELKKHGIKTITNDKGQDIKLANAKTNMLMSALAKVGKK